VRRSRKLRAGGSAALTALLGLTLARLGAAAPSVTTAQGNADPGTTITVTGSGFGSQGPNVVMFDDFESSSPFKIGRWNGTPVSYNGGRSGSKSELVDSNAPVLTAGFGGSYSEALISYWVRLTTPRFPGDTTADYQFSSNSSWKFVWLMDGNGYHNDGLYDLCLPTHAGASGNFMLAGNDFNYKQIGNDWWSWTNWMRITVWIRDNSSNAGFFETFSNEKHFKRINFGSNPPFASGVTRTFSQLNVPGWIRSGGEPIYDDVYVAVGPGAVARVELADSPVYDDASTIDTLLVKSWSDSSINAEVPNVTVSSGQAYVFVTDANGNRSPVGLSLCTTCPAPPVLTVR
jgi:hypothetical protein